MIFTPYNGWDHKFICDWMKQHGDVEPAHDAHLICWKTDGELTWAIAYDGWCGYTCQMHMVSTQRFVPKQLRWTAFHYAFDIIKRRVVFGLVNGSNEKALRLDKFLGFREVLRMPECALDGADIVLLQLTADEWRAKNGRRQELESSCA